MRYAQINQKGICIADSFLSAEVIAENMILLTEDEPSPLTKKYVNGAWEEVKEQQVQIQSDEEIIMQAISELFEAQQERQMLAQQMADLELAMLEGGNANV